MGATPEQRKSWEDDGVLTVPDAVVGRVRSEVQRFAVDLLNNRTSIDNETIRDNRAGELRVARLEAGE